MEFPNRKENIKLLHFGVLNGKIILQVASPRNTKKRFGKACILPSQISIPAQPLRLSIKKSAGVKLLFTPADKYRPGIFLKSTGLTGYPFQLFRYRFSFTRWRWYGHMANIKETK